MAEPTVTGVLERIVFSNPTNGWTVARLDGESGPITIVGHLVGVKPGEQLRIQGTWKQDLRYGPQLEVQSYLVLQPNTTVGIEKYLSSGLVDGIGPALAERLVHRFGIQTLDIIEHHPERLTEVGGIGRVRAERLRDAWQAQRGVREVMIFLESQGISPAYAARIHQIYGQNAIARVRENPYRLAFDIRGIGFRSADKIALGLGMDRRAPQRLVAGLLHALGEAAEEGHCFLPRDQLFERASAVLEIEADLAEPLEGLISNGHAVDDDGHIYLTLLHQAEVRAAWALKALLSQPAGPVQADVAAILSRFEASQGITFSEAQRRALLEAPRQKVLVITGGPGTGKTTLVNGLLQVLGGATALAAPTGRAAKRMQEATGKEAKTIHRLLQYDPETHAFTRNSDAPLEAETVVVDEVSMLDVKLFADLLEAVPPKARLVLVGDVDQLPSVGPGAVLADLIASATVPVVRLDRIFRQAGGSRIVENAHRVNAGQLPELATLGQLSDFYLIEREDPEAIAATLEKVVAERIPERFGFHSIRDVQILTPMRKGVVGAQALNRRLQARLNPSTGGIIRGEERFAVGDKVMQTKNDYDLGVFNGDLGVITSLDPDGKWLEVQMDDRSVRYDSSSWDALHLAYAVTIHKSQGSEYPAVVIPLSTQHYVMLHRRLLYTALTRGKRLVVLVGSSKALKLAVDARRDEARHTGLAARLQK